MKTSKFTRAVALFLSVVFAMGALGIGAAAATGADGLEHKDGMSDQTSFDTMEKYLNSKSYAEYSAGHQNDPAGEKKLYVDLSTAKDQNGDSMTVIDTAEKWSAVTGTEDGYEKTSERETDDAANLGRALFIPSDGSVTFEISVPSNGMYYICFKYFTVEGTVNGIERQLLIDDTIPFSEARYLKLSKVWSYNYIEENGKKAFREDLIGNSLTPDIDQTRSWRTYFCMDAEGYTTDYYRFFFSKTTADKPHTITLVSERESFVLGSIELVPANSTDKGIFVPSYEEYINQMKNEFGAAAAPADAVTRIEAETPDYVSDSSIYMTNDRSSALTSPSVSNAQLYNVIGANSYNNIGQWASYNFTVDKTGLYNIILRYKQSSLEGMYICRAVKLWSDDGMYGLPDGTPTVPFKEAYNLRYNYSKDWQVSKVNDGATEFELYFKEGVQYTVTFEVSLGSLASQLQTIKSSLKTLNDSYLRIIQLTGASPDKYRDYQFTDIMPDVVNSLCEQAIILAGVKAYFEDICQTTGSHTATLETVARLLSDMGTDETQIAEKIDTMKAYLGTLGTWLNSSRTSSLTVDSITIAHVQNNKDLPKANANIFQSFWFEIRSFFSSFVTKYDQMGVTSASDNSEGALNVWLASGRDQSKIWRSLIDSEFSSYCSTESEYCRANGMSSIPVNLKLITAGTLLPSILADKGPDVYMGLDSTTTINFAIRGAIEPIYSEDPEKSLTGSYKYLFEDGLYHSAAINTVELLGNVYGVPMTMNFSMMFYRVDVLVKLKSSVPETWSDLLGMLPVLQANNLAAGLGTPLEMLLYQNGASMWRYDDKSIYGGVYAGAQIGLDTNTALDVFQYYCRLYTDYGFPYQYDASNRFRTGEMPIIIGDYITVYNQLVVFATEINGLWEFSSVPGTRDDEGKLNYDAMATVTNTVMPHSKKRTEARRLQSWEYILWCNSADAQSSYGNRMVALIGPSAKYAAANMDAISKLSWTTKEARAIKDQLDHLNSVKNYPGSYIIARYIEFAFLAAYNYNTKKIGEDPVDAMNSYISAINSELLRKREEFADSGLKTLKPGQTPDQAEAEND